MNPLPFRSTCQFDTENEAHSHADLHRLLAKVCAHLSTELAPHGVTLRYRLIETPSLPVDEIVVEVCEPRTLQPAN